MSAMTLLGSTGRPAWGAPAAPQNAAPSSVPTITEREFEAEVMRSEQTVLLQFGSERSAASRAAEPALGEIAREYEGKLKVLKVDVEQSPYLTQQLRISQLPTYLLWAEGRPADMQPGPLSKKQLQAMVEPHLPRPAGAVKPLELAELIKKGVVATVDTRDAAAFKRAHLPKAVHMPLEELEGRVAELYMLGGTPVLYCRAGDKTRELVAKMAEAGVELGYLEGGLLAWESEGYPIER